MDSTIILAITLIAITFTVLAVKSKVKLFGLIAGGFYIALMLQLTSFLVVSGVLILTFIVMGLYATGRIGR